MSRKRDSRPLMQRLIAEAEKYFGSVTTGDCNRRTSYTARDCLFSGFAMFLFKYSSMLKFDRHTHDAEKHVRDNLKCLFDIDHAPSDTTLRRRLDDVDPTCIHRVMRRTFAFLRELRLLERFRVYDRRIPVMVDGTRFFTSTKVKCERCLPRKVKGGGIRYEHGAVVAAAVHPAVRQALPAAAECIVQQDGVTKQDCEMNAFKRLLPRLLREHRGLKFVVIMDALYAVQPVVDLLRDNDTRFILGAKPKGHAYLLAQLKGAKRVFHSVPDEPMSWYRWKSNVDLNESSKGSCKVTVLEQVVMGKDDKEQTFTWATDLPVKNLKNAMKVAALGRSRWRIENTVFHVLKDADGYHFEHNYGHGKQHLCSVMMLLMLTAFLFDQAAALGCEAFQAALVKARQLRELWDVQRAHIWLTEVYSWTHLYQRLGWHRQPP